MPRGNLPNACVRPAKPFAPVLPKVILAAFVLVWLVAWLPLLNQRLDAGSFPWTEPALLLLALAAVAAGLTRQLPAQNVLLACGLLLVAGGALQVLNLRTGIPFGSRLPADATQLQLAWFWPVIWATALLACRGVARLLLQPIRGSRFYGFWMLGMTVLLCLLFELSLEPYATLVARAWTWAPAKIHLEWYGTPWVNFIGWCVASLLVLAFVTPIVISKHPVPPPPSYYPFWVWLLLKILFVSGAAKWRLWGVAVVTGVELLAITLSLSWQAGRKGEQTRRSKAAGKT